jgi:hypothetical protein
MWLAWASCAIASQNAGAPSTEASANRWRTPGAQEAGTEKAAREKIQSLTGPSEASTLALRGGYLKLKRLCEFGSTTPSTAPYEPPLISPKTRGELSQLTRTLEQVTDAYRQKSRVSAQGSCQFLPKLLVYSGACQGYFEDSARLKGANEAAQQLVSQARERLDLYDRYLELEHRGCTRDGFARRLWASEESNLWPLLLEVPAAFKQYLPSPRAD